MSTGKSKFEFTGISKIGVALLPYSEALILFNHQAAKVF